MKLNNNPAKKYQATKTLVWSCQYHVIFCPKYRRPVLADGVDARLKELILSKQTDYEFSLLEMEVMPDHVHLLIEVSPQVGVHSVVSKIKGHTSHELRTEFPHLRSRLPTLWTRSKFISTVGSVTLAVVKKYIEEQKYA